MNEIYILQLGGEDWNKRYSLPQAICLDYAECFRESSLKSYDLFFLDRNPLEEEIEPLYRAIKAYTLFVTEHVDICGGMEWLCKCKKAKYIRIADLERFFLREAKYYYSGSYGEKFDPPNLAIAQGFAGVVDWNGNYEVSLEGDFGSELGQIAYWRNNIPLFQGQVIDLWLEYHKSRGVEISLVVTMFASGSVSSILKQWEFSEKELENVVQIENSQAEGNIFVSVRAGGSGKLQIVALHDRYSRGNHGYFLPGGERYVTSDREEIFCYFDPGDLKPPLNVYFAGYKTKQGFEGYNLMRGMGCPFLLLSEPRLEGGCLYVGTGEYEKLVITIIRRYMRELGFTSDQIILSGISGGTYGALYYGCDIRPHAMILGKPVPSLGDVAANEKHLRPGGLPTTLDMLKYLIGDTDKISVKKLNERFWNKFDAVDWGKSKFVVAYMIEDDYDPTAYDMLLSHLWSSGVQVYGKGIHGRHNDNTPAIVKWFTSQYKKILYEDFSRRKTR